MKYHSSLLNQYIDIQDTPENIANQLTCKICEIEETIMRTIPEKVVIGKVMDAEKHPDADKLFVCHIDSGKAGNPLMLSACAQAPDRSEKNEMIGFQWDDLF